jgi:2-methylisocitrate lyase-like PEP mutase family enzyme
LILTPKEKAEHFRTLHVPGRPLVLFNIWDPGSAKAVVAAGAQAIATGSWSVANANGYADGERVPLDFAIDNLLRIVQAVDVPVTVDLESGYGKTRTAVAQAVDRTTQAGAIGCNLEDSFPENGELREVPEQVERIKHARKAADAANGSYFINARTDVFLRPSPRGHDDAALADVLNRARAYADAGANGLFVPGLTDETLIAQLTAASPLPLNIMVGGTTPSLSKLAQLGVARVSHGPGPYLAMMKKLEEAARDAAIAV